MGKIDWNALGTWAIAFLTFLTLRKLNGYARDTTRMADTAVKQADTAAKQLDVALRQNKEMFRPILVVTDVVESTNRRRKFTVINQGSGPALHVQWQAEGRPDPSSIREGPTETHVLGPKCKFDAEFTAEPSTKLFFVYRSTFGDESGTEVIVTDCLFTNHYYPLANKRGQIVE
jgi:hypothetical protein